MFEAVAQFRPVSDGGECVNEYYEMDYKNISNCSYAGA